MNASQIFLPLVVLLTLPVFGRTYHVSAGRIGTISGMQKIEAIEGTLHYEENVCPNNDTTVTEVIGANGRMGSLWLRSRGAVPVPRDIAPGCLSPDGSAIFCATPAASWSTILKQTPKDRVDDLVWIGNGLLLEEFENASVVIPHYGILAVGEKPYTSPISPPTFIFGKHSAKAKDVLDKNGVRTEILHSWHDIRVAAARKLIWASTMWLICHLTDPPCTVGVAHRDHEELLEELVKEMLPALNELVGEADLNKTMQYLQVYSNSMPNAIPSMELAKIELQQRNGVWMRLRRKFPQPLHEKLLLDVCGPVMMQKALASETSSFI